MATTMPGVRLSFWLGVLSLIAVAISHLTLTDISHGQGGITEWRALQASFLVIGVFQVSALATLRRLMRSREPAMGPDARS